MAEPFRACGLPQRGRGRPSQDAQARFDMELRAFAGRILEINSTLDFKVSSRGWGYILEGRGEITKGDLDAAQRTINDCRKRGLLPLDICAEDERRVADGIEKLNGSIEDEVQDRVYTIRTAANSYTPIGFWDNQGILH